MKRERLTERVEKGQRAAYNPAAYVVKNLKSYDVQFLLFCNNFSGSANALGALRVIYNYRKKIREIRPFHPTNYNPVTTPQQGGKKRELRHALGS